MTTPPNDPNDPYQNPQQPPAQQPPAYPGDAPGYPGANQYGQPMPTPEPPNTILNAVKLMYVGAGISALGVLVALLSLGGLKDDIAEADPTLTADQIDAAYSIAIVFAVVLAGIGVALWLWMAAMNKKGRSWARVVATVLGGLNVLFIVIGLANTTGLQLIFNLATLVVAALALWFMYRPDSSAYYQAVTQSRVTR